MSEKFSLRWNDFESNISATLGDLRASEDFLDVTLVCEREQLRAHKLIISACSPFFRNILHSNPHQNPLLYLKGIKSVDMKSLLDFMYLGEVSIYQEHLNSFLQVAEDLEIKGLTQRNENREESKLKPLSRDQQQTTGNVRDPAPVNAKTFRNSKYEPETIRTGSHQTVKTESKESNPEVVDISNSVTEYVGEEEYNEDVCGDYGDADEAYGHHSQSMDLSSTGPTNVEELSQYVISDVATKEYTCALCQTFKAKLPSKVKNHLEAIHFPGMFLYNCDICFKTFKGRNAFNIHKSNVHPKKFK